MSFLAFGPLAYEVHGSVPSSLEAWTSAPTPGARPLDLIVGQVFPRDAREIHGTAVRALGARDEVYLPGAGGVARWLSAPLAQLVARDLGAHGGLLLHASAVRVAAGVALLTGPPGVGKTTFARHDPARAFAGNAVAAWPVDGTWNAVALPFASDPDPALDAPDRRPIAAVVELRRGTSPAFEWIPGSAATRVVARACVMPVLGDPWRSQRAASLLDLAASVAIASLAAAGSRADLAHLDRGLHP